MDDKLPREIHKKCCHRTQNWWKGSKRGTSEKGQVISGGKLKHNDFGLLLVFPSLSTWSNLTASSFKFNVLKIKTNLRVPDIISQFWQLSWVSSWRTHLLGHCSGWQNHGRLKSSLSPASRINSSSLLTVATPRSPFFLPELYLMSTSHMDGTKVSQIKHLI